VTFKHGSWSDILVKVNSCLRVTHSRKGTWIPFGGSCGSDLADQRTHELYSDLALNSLGQNSVVNFVEWTHTHKPAVRKILGLSLLMVTTGYTGSQSTPSPPSEFQIEIMITLFVCEQMDVDRQTDS
jgi:hypothetical protein